MERQIEPKVKPEEQKRHLIKAYLDDEEYEKFQQQADLMFRMCAEMSSILLRCGAKINNDLIEPSPFLTELLRKYDVEAKEARKKVDA